MNIELEDESEESDIENDHDHFQPPTEEQAAEAEAEDLAELDQERDLLVQLQLLHKKLANVRAKEAKTEQNQEEDEDEDDEVSDGASSKCPKFLSESNKLIVCSVRKPVTMTRSRHGDAWAYRTSQSSLQSSINYISQSNNVKWVGWPGAYVEESTRDAVRNRLEDEYQFSPIFMGRDAQELVEGYWGDVLFPNLHGIPTDFFSTHEHMVAQYDAYSHFNVQYAEKVAEIYEPGDIVLVHNFELMLLPHFLRRRIPRCTIGFFMHVPFPSSEIFQELPKRSQLLKGILGSDLIAFNHFEYIRHFQNSCIRTLGLEAFHPSFELGRHCSFSYQNRRISLEICPAGIDPQKFRAHFSMPASPLPSPSPSVKKQPMLSQTLSSISSEASSSNVQVPTDVSSPTSESMKVRSVSSLVKSLTERYRKNGNKLILSIDHMDWCKGLPQKLTALESFFTDYPHWRGKVAVFVVVRDHPGGLTSHIMQLRQTVNRLVGRVNGKFGFADYVPVHFIHRTMHMNEIIALYTVADAMLVTSIREGINLTALEFIACQSAHILETEANSVDGDFDNEVEKGVLIYSEFAGCVSSFKGSLVVNPYDGSAVAKAINEALIMRSQTKRVRLHQLERYVSEYTSSFWATRMMKCLSESASLYRTMMNGLVNASGAIKLDMSHLRSFYERSTYRLLVLDYDGALMPVQPLAQLSAPSDVLLSVLHALCSDPCNCVIITTRHQKEVVEEWFESIPNIGLIADHGYWIRPPTLPLPFQDMLYSSTVNSSSSLHNNAPSPSASVTKSFESSDHKMKHALSPTQPTYPHTHMQDNGEGVFKSPQTMPPQSPPSMSLEASSPTAQNLKALGLSSLPSVKSLSDLSDMDKQPKSQRLESVQGVKGGVVDIGDFVKESNRWLQVDYNENIDLSWMDEVYNIFEEFTQRTPGSLLEHSECCLTWHYRDSDADFGMAQAKILQLHLDQMLRKFPVRVSTAGEYKCITLQPLRVSKGRALQYLLTQIFPEQHSKLFSSSASLSSLSTSSSSHSMLPHPQHFRIAEHMQSTINEEVDEEDSEGNSTSVVPSDGTPTTEETVSFNGEVPLTPTTLRKISTSYLTNTAPSTSTVSRRFEVALSISDDRTHEDLPSVWKGSHPILSELSHGLFAVSTGGTKASKSKWCVEDCSEVLLVLKALAEVSAKLGHDPHWGMRHAPSSFASATSSLNI